MHWNLVAERVLGKGENNTGYVSSEEDGLRATDYGYSSSVDHSPHELFIKLDELQGQTWVEKSRYDMTLYFNSMCKCGKKEISC